MQVLVISTPSASRAAIARASIATMASVCFKRL
jgi:hypothetical protein